MEQELKKRIEELEKRFNQLEISSQIPLSIENALIQRGFLTNNTSFISGTANLDGDGQAFFPVEKAKTYHIALNNRGITSYIRNSTTSTINNELFLAGGDPAMVVNWVILLNTDILFD